jgi:Na+/H+-dicarboxylate symporter
VKKSFYLHEVILAVVLGCLTGYFFGSRAAFLGELGTLLIKLLKALATPLVFFAILDAFCKTSIRTRHGLRLISISVCNAIVAGLIAILVSSAFPLGSWQGLIALKNVSVEPSRTSAASAHSMGVMGILNGLVPDNILEPFITNHIVSVVVIAVLLGIAMRKLKNSSENHRDYEILEGFWSGGLHLISELLRWVVRGVPFAVFGVLAKTVGTNGFGVFTEISFFVITVATGIFIHIIVYYSALLGFVARVSPLQFFKKAVEPLATAFGTGSSLATLPVTLRTLQEKMKISRESSRLAACVGTNLNHDGILLYEAVAALFVAHIYGIHLGVGQKILLLGASALAAVGIAGIPDAGLITLSLVLSAVDLPLGLIPVLMTVDWFIGRLRALTNVTSDMVVATVLDHGWNKYK